MNGQRTILHCDCNGFYASVECVLDPKLKNVPMAVAGDPEKRHGIILAKNELAKGYGVTTAETIASARRKCPSLVTVAPHHGIYKDFSERINEIYRRYTDLVEPFSIDESWLDVTGSRRLFGDGKTIADKLRQLVREETGVTISVGVSWNKIFAKMGSDYKKPDATTVITPANFRRLLYPLPAGDLFSVGKKTAETLASMGIFTIGDIAAAREEDLARRLGKAGRMISRYARGLDDEPVRSASEEREVKSIGNGATFEEDIRGEEEYRRRLLPLSQSVARRLRKRGLKCMSLQVTVKTPEFRTIQRQAQLETPLCTSRDICEEAMAILKKTWNMSQPARMLTVTAGSLVAENMVSEQLSLFEDENKAVKKREKIEKTVDELYERFGGNIQLGTGKKKEKE